MTRFEKVLFILVVALTAVLVPGQAWGQEPDSILIEIVDRTTAVVVYDQPERNRLSPGDTLTLTGAVVDSITGEPIPGGELRWYISSGPADKIELNAVSGFVTALGPGQAQIGFRATIAWDTNPVPPDTMPPPDAAFFDDFGDAAGVCGWTPRASGETGHSAASSQPAVDVDGNCALRFTYGPDAPGEDSQAEHRVWLDQRRPEVWVTYDWFVPPNFWMRDERPANNKFFRIFTRESPPSLAVTTEFSANVIVGREPGTAYARRAIIDAESWAWWPAEERPDRSDYQLFVGFDSTYLVQPGEWASVRMRFKASSGPQMADGWIYREVNGEVLQDNNWAMLNKTAVTSEIGFDLMYLMGWSNLGYTDQTTFYIDNLAVGYGDPGW